MKSSLLAIFVSQRRDLGVELISIGMVNDKNEILYRCNSKADLTRASPWVRENVLIHLPKYGETLPTPDGDIQIWQEPDDIAKAIRKYVGDEKPAFWAFYGAYDWVLFCRLFKGMLSLPEHWPQWFHEFKQLLEEMGNPRMTKNIMAHNALHDAVHLKDNYYRLVRPGT